MTTVALFTSLPHAYISVHGLCCCFDFDPRYLPLLHVHCIRFPCQLNFTHTQTYIHVQTMFDHSQMPCVCLSLDHLLQRAIQLSLGRHYRAVQGESNVFIGDTMSVHTLDFWQGSYPMVYTNIDTPC